MCNKLATSYFVSPSSANFVRFTAVAFYLQMTLVPTDRRTGALVIIIKSKKRLLHIY